MAKISCNKDCLNCIYDACLLEKRPKQMPTGNRFGDRLKKARLARELDQKEVGRLIGVKNNTVSNWEHNISSPKPIYLPRIYAVFPEVQR